jgi:small-conductance mechanosensitive channel
MNQLQALIKDFSSPNIWLELGALLACLGIAYAVSRMAGRRVTGPSVWFGLRIVDGLMFPLVAMLLTYGTQQIWFAAEQYVFIKVIARVLLALAAIRLIARVLSAAYPNSRAAKLIERFFSWFVWLGVVLWLLGVLPLVRQELDAAQFNFGKAKVSLLTVFEGLLSGALVLIVTLWISAAIESRLLRETVQDLSLRKIAGNAIRAVLLFVGMLLALSAVGFDLTALSVLGGALGVGLGFGLQKLAANYVSGFVILAERSLRIGDTVKIDGFEGRVSDIKTRYTVVRSPSGREAIVPNEKLITERVENLSTADPTLQLTSAVSVSYKADVDLVRRILADAATKSPRVLANPSPAAHLSAFGADGLEFTLCYFINDPDNGQLNVRGEVNLAVLAALREAGIEIPHPQRVVHQPR